MNIAITGGTGFIGSQFDYNDEHEYYLLCHHGDPAIGTCKKDNVHYKILDFSPEPLIRAMDELSINSLLHLAYIRPVRNSSMSSYQENLSLTHIVFYSAEKSNIRNIVFCSSRAVYGRSADIPAREDSVCNPDDLYGLSKLQCEQLAQFYNQFHGMKIKSIRLARVFGYQDACSNFLSSACYRAVTGQAIEVFGKLQGRFEYIYVKDAVGALKVALAHPELVGTYNVGSGESFSLLELTNLIKGVIPDVRVQMCPEKESDEGVYLMDSRKFSEQTKWRPGFRVADGIRDSYIEWCNNNG